MAMKSRRHPNRPRQHNLPYVGTPGTTAGLSPAFSFPDFSDFLQRKRKTEITVSNIKTDTGRKGGVKKLKMSFLTPPTLALSAERRHFATKEGRRNEKAGKTDPDPQNTRIPTDIFAGPLKASSF